MFIRLFIIALFVSILPFSTSFANDACQDQFLEKPHSRVDVESTPQAIARLAEAIESSARRYAELGNINLTNDFLSHSLQVLLLQRMRRLVVDAGQFKGAFAESDQDLNRPGMRSLFESVRDSFYALGSPMDTPMNFIRNPQLYDLYINLASSFYAFEKAGYATPLVTQQILDTRSLDEIFGN